MPGSNKAARIRALVSGGQEDYNRRMPNRIIRETGGSNGSVKRRPGAVYARCSMRVEARHMNAAGAVMGGALFTLADLAFAAAANEQQPLTVSLTSQITYLNPGRGNMMYAEARAIKSGKRNCTFIIDITDENGVKVAVVISTGARIG